MGIYLDPGNTNFKIARCSDIYVDKSMLISKTNAVYMTERRFLCVSRARRFGKSMAANMLSAYYSCGCNSAELFSGLEIEKEESFPGHLNRHHVIRLDVQRFLETERELVTFIGEIERRVIGELQAAFPECNCYHEQCRLKDVLDQIFVRTREGFIFIIDEWDCVFRMARQQKEIQKKYLDFLRGLFKGAEYVELAYMTGILPIKKYGEHSALNMFDEFSMVDPADFATFYGFTEEEVMRLCREKQVDFREMQKWYDGYLLNGTHIYNPKSVSDAVRRGKLKSYWTGTETYEALKTYIDRNFDGLREGVIEMLGNRPCKVDTSTSQNDMTTFKNRDDVITLLIHLGYLAYDETEESAFIPNQEIEQEFLRAVKTGGWEGLTEALNRSEELLKRTWELDGEAVAKGLEAIHSETTSLLKYNNENSLTCVILMAYYSAKIYYMNPIFEMPAGKGFADVVYLPKRNTDCPALVVVLKWNQTANGAIGQIRRKEYADWIREYTGDILLVGIHYNKKSKVHSCVIERWRKVQ